jgi:hypothetical protein
MIAMGNYWIVWSGLSLNRVTVAVVLRINHSETNTHSMKPVWKQMK